MSAAEDRDPLRRAIARSRGHVAPITETAASPNPPDLDAAIRESRERARRRDRLIFGDTTDTEADQ